MINIFNFRQYIENFVIEPINFEISPVEMPSISATNF